MNKVLVPVISILLGVCAFNANAQIIEDFEGNSLNWQEYSSVGREAVIKEGVLHLKSANGKTVYATCTAPIDCAEPFKISAKTKNLKLDNTSKGILIIFNYSDDYNCDLFRISKESIEYYRFQDGNKVRFKDTDFKLNKKLKEHSIDIQYKNRKIELSIDDVMSLEVSYMTMVYNGFGFGVYGDDQEASIDRVEFRRM